MVTVQDNGIGKPDTMFPREREVFTRVDRADERSQRVQGVGLPPVQRLEPMPESPLEVHGPGPHPDRTLVRPPLLSAAFEDPSPQAEKDGADTSSTRRRILVADDNRVCAESFAMMLQLMGHDVATAHDGVQAVEVARTFRPHVVLLDIGMPKLNGYEAARRIREQPWSQGMILIAATGWSEDEDRRRSLDAGFNYHLVKPLDPMELEQLLDKLS